MVTVVCTGGEAPPHSFCRSWLNSCDRVIAADGGLVLLKTLGYRANLWIGDGDSLEGDLNAWSPWFDESLLLDREKDDTDTEAAVEAALRAGSTEVWLMGGAGGRMDHWLSNLRLVASEPTITRWLTSAERASLLGPGSTLEVGSGCVSTMPVGSGPWKARSVGLRWPLELVDFGRWYSLSNQAEKGSRISVEEGRFLVLEPFLPGPTA